VSFELSVKQWVVTSASGLGFRPRKRSLRAGDLVALEEELSRARARFGLSATARIVSCYEAGRDGFWLHHCLVRMGVENRVVDSSSVEVPRRRRRAKTDRLDGESLLRLLLREAAGERGVWRVVRVPAPEVEAARQLHRELEALKHERTRHRNRVRSLLATVGVRDTLRAGFLVRLATLRQWDGAEVPSALRRRLEREWQRLELVCEQIRHLEAQRQDELQREVGRLPEVARQLAGVRGIGGHGAWVLSHELFGWRRFRNRRQVGAAAGLVPTPHQSGDAARELGIAKAGNRRVRVLMIQLAWGWLRFQPDSALSQWYERRFGHGSKRLRRIGIVALARKLLIELWKYVETGVVPEGARLKPTS